MITKEDIQVMKENEKAFVFWPTEWQEWATRNWQEFQTLSGTPKTINPFSDDVCYRLNPDYQLPEEKKRWFVDLRPEYNGVFMYVHPSGDIKWFEGLVASNMMLEVQENELPYLERPKAVEGFYWVFKIPELGEQVLSALVNNKKIFSQGHTFNKDTNNGLLGRLHEYRWVKVPKKNSGFVEYDVKRDMSGYYIADSNGIFMATLSRAINSPKKLGLFSGIKFEGQKKQGTWYMNARAMIKQGGDIFHSYTPACNTLKPAIPVRARFWIWGEV